MYFSTTDTRFASCLSSSFDGICGMEVSGMDTPVDIGFDALSGWCLEPWVTSADLGATLFSPVLPLMGGSCVADMNEELMASSNCLAFLSWSIFLVV